MVKEDGGAEGGRAELRKGRRSKVVEEEHEGEEGKGVRRRRVKKTKSVGGGIRKGRRNGKRIERD